MTSKDNLKNIFLMPCGAAKTKENFNNTVLLPVPLSTIWANISAKAREALDEMIGIDFPDMFEEFAVWGSVEGSNNRIFFNKMHPQDYIVFTIGKQVKAVGQIIFKTISPKLSKVLWPGNDKRVYSLIYVIDNVVKVNTPLSRLFKALGYSENYLLRGLTSVSGERLKAFYQGGQDIFSLVTDTKREESK